MTSDKFRKTGENAGKTRLLYTRPLCEGKQIVGSPERRFVERRHPVGGPQASKPAPDACALLTCDSIWHKSVLLSWTTTKGNTQENKVEAPNDSSLRCFIFLGFLFLGFCLLPSAYGLLPPALIVTTSGFGAL